MPLLEKMPNILKLYWYIKTKYIKPSISYIKTNYNIKNL